MANLLIDTWSESAFIAALESTGEPRAVLGGGTNLIVSDDGFPGTVIRYNAAHIARPTPNTLTVDSGANLDDLVIFTVHAGLGGMESLRRIPGWVGAAIYGNAGAYGQQISDHLVSVRIHDGRRVRELSAADCGFVYRGSVFKHHKDWLILSATFHLPNADPLALADRAEKIRATRDAKFPPSMKCAGSIFKNLHVHNLPVSTRERIPESVVQYSKVPAAWFLEQVGAKGRSQGGIHVADNHANLIYNAGRGTSGEFITLIDRLKAEVHAKFGILLEEEVQFVGFPTRNSF